MLAKALASASASVAKVYVEDVFSTWLYTGNGSTQTITNGIDLSGKGGLVWLKDRVYAGGASHNLYDTVRGALKFLNTDSSSGESSISAGNGLTSFTSTGFSLGTNWNNENRNGDASVSWTFRKAAKFFDVVTYTGNGTAGRTVSHNLGSTPGCIILKEYSAGTGDNWYVWHRGFNNGDGHGFLNTTAAFDNATTPNIFGNGSSYVAPTSTNFTVGGSGGVNESGASYVAYLFAHDAGGFGDSGNDSVVKCGSWTVTGSSQDIDLGWEPQWLLVKRTDSAGAWYVVDNMRGFSNGQTAILYPYLSNAEYTDGTAYLIPTATGFKHSGLYSTSSTVAYIAIRRGPMKTPTDATKVFAALTATVSTGTVRTTNFPIDLQLVSNRPQNAQPGHFAYDRLRGVSTTGTAGGTYLDTTYIGAEDTNIALTRAFDNTGFTDAAFLSGYSAVWWNFRRAPGFFDVVAYKGTSNSLPQTISHNLGVKPEMMIVKRRDTTSSYGWHVWHSAYEVVGGLTSQYALLLNTTAAIAGDAGWWNQTSPTSTSFTVGDRANMLNGTFIAYLFASCPGVSKVGSYTGTGTTLNVDCGFTNGSRLVLIKRTDSTGDWYVWDTARGIIAANDPYLLLNSTAAEVTNTDYIDPLSSGFQISSTAPAAINASGGSFIFLAIA